MSELLAGLIAGAVHVWLGPDHLAAIAPFAVQRRRRFWSLGAQWGIGHCLGVAIVALAALSMRELISPVVLSTWGERTVGVLLVGIGLWGFNTILSVRPYAAARADGGPVQGVRRLHAHGTSPAGCGSHRYLHAALGVGILHGVAGGSHFLGVLPAMAFPTLAQALAYLGGFAVGTIAAMVAFSGLAGSLARWSALKGVNAHRVLLGMTSAAAAGVGFFWLAQV